MSKKEILVVDVQVLQTDDRNRGMGLFTKSLLVNLENKKQDIIFIANIILPKLDKECLELAKSLEARIVYLELKHRTQHDEFKNAEAYNVHTIDKFIRNLGPSNIKYFLPALFSRDIYPVFPTSGTTNIVLFYDLIPFLYFKNYFPDHSGTERKDYAQRFRQFYKADFITTISDTTGDDLTIYLGVDPSRIVPILGAAADRTHTKPIRPKIDGLKKEFILMPSGDDFRKNNEFAVRAFNSLSADLQLVITSKFTSGTKKELQRLCPNVIFTDSVSDGEFLWLLDNAKVVFFPPEYEGLGMPILEAVQRKAIIACSNIPVFTEISENSFFYFDPKSIASMRSALTDALNLNKKEYISRVDQDYKRILKKFNWESVAKRFTDMLSMSAPAVKKRKLAVFCPSPSSYSSVGKYAFEIHAELSRFFDIDYYAEDGLTAFEPTRPNILEYASNYYPASTFKLEHAKQYDHVLYNVGNSEFHIDTILNALRLPANAVIHDTRLNGIFDWLERHKFLSLERRQLESKLDEILKTKDTTNLVSIATNQKALVVHSSFAKRAISKISTTKVYQTIHPIGVPKVRIKKDGNRIVSFAGIISESKGINIVAEIAKNKSVNVNIFGFGVLGDSPLLNGLGENVAVTKDLTDKEFQDKLRQTDILVNYRPKYNGETSRSALEAMRHGVVVIVKNVGWYGELPDDVVVKVDAESEVVPAIEGLLNDPTKMEKISMTAQKFLAEEYSYGQYAKLLNKELERQ